MSEMSTDRSIANLDNNLRKQLDVDQYQVATTRTERGYRRVKGPAGSGKSLALAARAAMLASEGKRVLVCTFNITLHNYLRDIVEQLVSQQISRQIIFTNFHAWCKGVCEDSGLMDAYNKLWEDYTKKVVWEQGMAELVSEIYDNPSDSFIPPTYDAILVDEGQDYRVPWWQTLRKAIVKDGEMLLVADMTQNIHGTAQAWTEETMLGLSCGFTGPWMTLSERSYRLPASLIPVLEEFVRQFPYDGEKDIPDHRQFNQADALHKYRWLQVSSWEAVVDACVKEIECLWNDPDISTVYFLSEKELGMKVVNKFEQKEVNILSTHSDDWQRSRSQKVGFHPGCAEICATTPHSFKGWEACHIVVHVERIWYSIDRALFYTALSRLNEDPNGSALTVVSSCPDLENFGRNNFPDFVNY